MRDRLRLNLLVFLLLAIPFIGTAPGFAQSSSQAYRQKTAGPQISPQLATRMDALKLQIAKNSKDISARVELSAIQLQLKQYDEVILNLKPVLSQLPRRGLLFLAQACEEKKDYLNEIRALNHMIDDMPSDYRAETMLGDAECANKDSNDGIKDYRKAIKINPRYITPYEHLAAEFAREKDNYDRRDVLQQMQQEFGNTPEISTDLCADYTKEGFIDKAILICNIAVKANPTSADNLVHLGLDHLYAGDKDLAHQLLFKAAVQFPKSLFAQISAGKLAASLKKWGAAEKLYQRATLINPKSRKAQIGLARAAFQLEDYKLSLAAYVHACHINRKYILNIRVAANKLRDQKKSRWAERFSHATVKCE